MKRIAIVLVGLMAALVGIAPPANAGPDDHFPPKSPDGIYWHEQYASCSALETERTLQLVATITERDQLSALSKNQAWEIGKLNQSVDDLDEMVDEAWAKIARQRSTIEKQRALIRDLRARLRSRQ